MDGEPEQEELWTDVHKAALKEADTLLRKYFDAYVLCIQVHSADTHKETERYSFVGGKMVAIGLAQTFVNGMTKDDTWQDSLSQ